MKYLPLALCIIVLMACGPNSSQMGDKSKDPGDSATNAPTALTVRPIEGYFVKNTIKQNDSVTCWLISSAVEQDSILGMAKTMTNTIDTIDFSREIIAAVVIRPSELTQSIRLASSEITDDEVRLHFAIKADTPKRTFTAAALWMAAFPKTPAVKAVKFYNGDKLMRTLDVAE